MEGFALTPSPSPTGRREQEMNGTKITPNPLPIRLLGVGCRVWGVVNKCESLARN
ncbi:hypothetical protein FDUTEX481_02364 [Tolypothrix sp. PCC 7601]|nr:hypothetical protein FDUTEX481_02364 [Tolypothrix sp. PCC 7601]